MSGNNSRWGHGDDQGPPHPCARLPSVCLDENIVGITTFQMLVNLDPTNVGYHLGASNLRSRPLSTFPSSILHFPLIAPPDLQLCEHSIILLNHIGPPPIERARSREDFNHSSSTDSLHN
jgi:hypothetical protein